MTIEKIDNFLRNLLEKSVYFLKRLLKSLKSSSDPIQSLSKSPFDSIRYPVTIQAGDELACTTALRSFQFDWCVLEHYLLHYGLKNVLRKTQKYNVNKWKIR